MSIDKKHLKKLVLNLIKRYYWNEEKKPVVYLLINGTVLSKRGEELWATIQGPDFFTGHI